MINKEIIYKTIREEILDQKKCQFQLISITATVTAAVLAYAAATKVGPLVYIAPMIMNVLSLVIILEKAITIQRKVGYLAMMEKYGSIDEWKWETNLEEYRAAPAQKCDIKISEKRKHKYVTHVSAMLVSLNAFCTALYFFGPVSIKPENEVIARALGWVDLVVVGLLLAGIVLVYMKRNSLVAGVNSSSAVLAKWESIINKGQA
ncbi:MAG: hypothetical protein ACUZ8N_12570 [Candidatus Scalindua sp.]